MPNAKKQRGKKKKAGAGAGAAAPKRPPGTAAAASRIAAANAVPDLSTGLEPFLSIDLPSAAGAADPVRLEIRSPKTLGGGDAQGMYDLLEGNMHDMYVEAGWGWNKAEKWREMEHRDARFLIARCGGGGDGTVGGEGGEVGGVASATAGVGGVSLAEDKGVDGDNEVDGAAGGPNGKGGAEDPGAVGGGCKAPVGAGPGSAQRKPAAPAIGGDRLAGYCHFRFAWDQDENEDGEGVGGTEDVLYVYELQVAPWAKRRGLGRRMMQALEVCSAPLFVAAYVCARRSCAPIFAVPCTLSHPHVWLAAAALLAGCWRRGYGGFCLADLLLSCVCSGRRVASCLRVLRTV